MQVLVRAVMLCAVCLSICTVCQLPCTGVLGGKQDRTFMNRYKKGEIGAVVCFILVFALFWAIFLMTITQVKLLQYCYYFMPLPHEAVHRKAACSALSSGCFGICCRQPWLHKEVLRIISQPFTCLWCGLRLFILFFPAF